MKLWEYRIKQYEYSLTEEDKQSRARTNYEIEEILGDFGKEGYELINVITEKIMIKKSNNFKYLRTFFLKKVRS